MRIDALLLAHTASEAAQQARGQHSAGYAHWCAELLGVPDSRRVFAPQSWVGGVALADCPHGLGAYGVPVDPRSVGRRAGAGHSGIRMVVVSRRGAGRIVDWGVKLAQVAVGGCVARPGFRMARHAGLLCVHGVGRRVEGRTGAHAAARTAGDAAPGGHSGRAECARLCLSRNYPWFVTLALSAPQAMTDPEIGSPQKR